MEMEPQSKILRLPAVMAKVGMSRSAVYAAVKNGHLPQQVRLTPGGRSMGWLSQEIDQYLKDMSDRRDDVFRREGTVT